MNRPHERTAVGPPLLRRLAPPPYNTDAFRRRARPGGEGRRDGAAGGPEFPERRGVAARRRAGRSPGRGLGADRPVALEILLPPPDDPPRAASLRELVKTDLEIRYRRGLSATLDEYLTQFPELAAGPDDALAELLYEEYRVRQRFGDRPPLESYQARFPRLYDALLRLVQENPVPTQAGPAPTPAGPVGVSVSGDFMESNRLLPIGGGYVLESLLGRGGFGEVCGARAPGGVLVAVKIIRRPADHEERIREERALEVVKQLHHHFLARTHQYHSDKESLFIVMELADCSLRDRLPRRRRPARAACRSRSWRRCSARPPRRWTTCTARGAAPRHQAGQHPAVGGPRPAGGLRPGPLAGAADDVGERVGHLRLHGPGGVGRPRQRHERSVQPGLLLRGAAPGAGRSLTPISPV